MTVSGGGVSAGGGGIDIEAIVSGGPDFAKRLQTFANATKAAADAKAEADAALKLAKVEADKILREADAVKVAAEKQHAENLAKADELAASLKAADELQANLTRRLEVINKICRE